MSRVFWDTNLFIYLVEEKGPLGERVADLRARMLQRNDQLFTSALTLGEVFIKPLETGDDWLRDEYQRLIVAAATIVGFDLDSARAYARIRRDRAIRAPDALQLACAAKANVDLFVTNDDRLSSRTIPGIQFITSLHRTFL